ncbi:MAG: NAD(P)-binding domain-containing protein, partial [Planctomycetota bacterium]
MLNKKIDTREARFGVVGMGYVGLPLAVEFAKVGFHATGFEVSEDKVARLMAGDSYIGDVTSEELSELVNAGKLDATTDFDAIAEMDIISICVPTPLSKTRDPD